MSLRAMVEGALARGRPDMAWDRLSPHLDQAGGEGRNEARFWLWHVAGCMPAAA